MESHFRSIMKAFTYRFGGLVVTCAVAFLITKRFDLAASLAVADTLAKVGLFYLHERLWLKVEFGRRKPPDYQI